MLRNLDISRTFLKATSVDLIKTFYEPALRESILYQRGTAYFSIEFLLRLMDSLVEFAYRGGSVQLVTSVELDENTLKSFADGYLLQDKDIVAALHTKLDEYITKAKTHSVDEDLRLDVIANMIAAKRLSIKIAAAENGIYHEKVGIFSDEKGESVAFFGSANETINAFYNNYETLTIGSSWGVGATLVEEYRAHFSKLWSNQEVGVQVIDFPVAVEKKLIGAFKKSPSLDIALQRLMQKSRQVAPVPSAKRQLHDYQKEAVKEFVQNDYCHLFEMATGTGKTFTAIKAIEEMALNKRYINAIVLVPLVDLQRQWEKAITEDLNVPYRIFKFGGCGNDDTIKFRLSTMTAASAHEVFATIAICVYDTYFTKGYRELKGIKGETLLVVDEAHNLHPGNVKVLSGISNYRLGLSATPTRYSKFETDLLTKLFLKNQQESYKYSLAKAIKNGFLSEYDYFPMPVELTEDELDRYATESKRIAALGGIYKNEPNLQNRQKLEEALMARSRIVKKSYNKLTLLDSLVSSKEYDFHNAVVFCGPGRLVVDGVTTQDRIVDLVTKSIGCNPVRKYFPAKYTSGESDRPARLDGFKKGLTDALVAVKCFDEGLDVPALDKIYLMASDSSLRQTIQRRGRVLRVSKDTGKTIAHIYDMVAGERIGGKFFALQTELPRVYEYARLSVNPQNSAGLLANFDPSETNNSFDELENFD